TASPALHWPDELYCPIAVPAQLLPGSACAAARNRARAMCGIYFANTLPCASRRLRLPVRSTNRNILRAGERKGGDPPHFSRNKKSFASGSMHRSGGDPTPFFEKQKGTIRFVLGEHALAC